MTSMMRPMEITFSQTPARTICLMLISPDPKATAFDGVATGNMYAEQTAKVTAIVMNSGSIPTPNATAQTIGKKAAAVAVLEVSSVSTKLTTMTATMIIQDCNVLRPETCPPTHSLNPVWVNMADNDRPPPNSSSKPHGTSLAADQRSSGAPVLSSLARFAGTRKHAIAAAMAT